MSKSFGFEFLVATSFVSLLVACGGGTDGSDVDTSEEAIVSPAKRTAAKAPESTESSPPEGNASSSSGSSGSNGFSGGYCGGCPSGSCCVGNATNHYCKAGCNN